MPPPSQRSQTRLEAEHAAGQAEVPAGQCEEAFCFVEKSSRWDNLTPGAVTA